MKDRDLLIQAAIEAAAEATDVVVTYTSGRDSQIRFSNGQVDIAKLWAYSKMSVFIALDRRIGSTEIENPTKPLIQKRVRELVLDARKMDRSPLYEGISGEALAPISRPKLVDEDVDGFGQAAGGLVTDTIQAAEEEGARSVAGSLIFGRDLTEIRTNYGAGGVYESSYYELNVRSFMDHETSGQGLACGRDISKAPERFLKAGSDSGRLAVLAKNGTQGRAGKYDLLMSPTVAANVLGQLVEGANPLMMMLGLSPLTDRLGSVLAPEGFSVIDDPWREEGLGSRPFDVEGVPTRPVDLFKDGRFVGVVHNTTTAKKAGGQTTGSSYLMEFGGSKIPAPWASNLVFEGGSGTREEIIEECRRPTIYVTSNWYTRFSNYAEGTFSTIPRDCTLLIEEGEVKRPIRKIRISENIIDLLSRLERLGEDVTQVHWWEVETPTYVPHMKFKDVNITAATM